MIGCTVPCIETKDMLRSVTAAPRVMCLCLHAGKQQMHYSQYCHVRICHDCRYKQLKYALQLFVFADSKLKITKPD